MEQMKVAASLKERQEQDNAAMARTREDNASAERIAAGKGGMGPKNSILGKFANASMGEDIWDPEAMVSPAEMVNARSKLNREKPPVAARGQYLGIKDAEGFLKQMQDKFSELSKQGKTGPWSGRVTRAKSFLTSGVSEPAAESYNRLKIGLVGRLKSVAGEVGRITDDDIKRMGALIAGLESGEVAAEDAFREIQETLARGRSNIEEVYPGVLKQMRGGSQSGEPKTKPVATGQADDDPMGINR